MPRENLFCKVKFSFQTTSQASQQFIETHTIKCLNCSLFGVLTRKDKPVNRESKVCWFVKIVQNI